MLHSEKNGLQNYLLQLLENPLHFIGLVFLAFALLACSEQESEPRVSGYNEGQENASKITHQSANWIHYGRGLSGDRFAQNVNISTDNIRSLQPAWQFQTGDIANGGTDYFGRRSSFKATPILFRDKLFVSTGFNRIIALKPDTGEQVWAFDPHVDFSIKYSEMFTSRGVTAWSDPEAGQASTCAHRIYIGTLDARLLALDAETGLACTGFGNDGTIDLSKGIGGFDEVNIR